MGCGPPSDEDPSLWRCPWRQVPTWIDLAGVDDPYAEQRDGISFAPLLRGDPVARANPAMHRTALVIEKLAAGGNDM